MLQANVIYSLNNPSQLIDHLKEECLYEMKDQVFNLIKNGGSFHFHEYEEEEKDFSDNFHIFGYKIYSIYVKYEDIYYKE